MIRERGDTLIEVMFAVAVFAMVAVGSLSIMNQGVAAAQRSLEVTLVRQQMQAQADAIRFIHDTYVTAYQQGSAAPTGIAAEWAKMTVDHAESQASPFGVAAATTCPSAVQGSDSKPFIVDARTAKVASQAPLMAPPPNETLPPFSQVIYNNDSSIAHAYGIWVEAVPSGPQPGGAVRYVDFHIRACWDSVGTNHPMTLGTIVRLYEPAA